MCLIKYFLLCNKSFQYISLELIALTTRYANIVHRKQWDHNGVVEIIVARSVSSRSIPFYRNWSHKKTRLPGLSAKINHRLYRLPANGATDHGDGGRAKGEERQSEDKNKKNRTPWNSSLRIGWLIQALVLQWNALYLRAFKFWPIRIYFIHSRLCCYLYQAWSLRLSVSWRNTYEYMYNSYRVRGAVQAKGRNRENYIEMELKEEKERRDRMKESGYIKER